MITCRKCFWVNFQLSAVSLVLFAGVTPKSLEGRMEMFQAS